MIKIVFIAGMAHSGTTLLDLMLSCHSRITGLGEVEGFINPKRKEGYFAQFNKRLCACGKTLNRCEVWAGFDQLRRKHPDSGFIASYEHLLGLISELYGEDCIVVDSSKYEYSLQNLLQGAWSGPAPDIHVIHLVKDVRNWAVSVRHKTTPKPGLRKDLRNFRQWRETNARIAAFLDTRGAKRLTVGYEELCIYPEYIAKLVCSFLDIPFEKQMVDLSGPESHIALGNPMRLDAKKSKRIYYDHRWFTDLGANLLYLLSSRARHLNERLVYSNVASWEESPRVFKPF